MEPQSPLPSPPPEPAETLVTETPNQQPSSSDDSDYFSPRTDDGSPELYDSPLLVEDATEGKGPGGEAEPADEVLNSSPRIVFSSNFKCDEVSVKVSESESPSPVNYNNSAGILPNSFLTVGQIMSYRPLIYPGAGFANLGNTCFLNSVLQCFLHTVPFLHGILSNNHLSCPCCTNREFCLIRSLRNLLDEYLVSSDVLPWEFFDNLSYFSSGFQKFQQEDAHEFLQCFLDRLESCDAKQKECLSLQRINIVKQVFGGSLVSKLKCCSCNHSSDTYEPSIDLSLEIEDADNLVTALQSFTKVEKLEDPETKFTCENCKEQVSFEKQLSFDEAPLVAAFHLKRFKTDGCFIQKIDKHVAFPMELDLFPFTNMGQNKHGNLNYELYAVVVHVGLTSTSGHYYCFIRISPTVWCKFDDSRVLLVNESVVLSKEAYILFYVREGFPFYSTFIETNKLGFYGSIWNTSPKSVLDTAALASPSGQEKVSCDSKEDSDDIALEHRVGPIEIQYSRSACRNIDNKAIKDNSDSVVPGAHDSLDVSLPMAKKEVSPLNQRQKASCDSEEESDDITLEHRVGPIEIQYSRSACRNIDNKTIKDNSDSAVPVAHDSLDASLPKAKKEVSPLNQRQDGSALGNSQDVNQVPMRSPSPEIYREDSRDAGFSIPRQHLKVIERRSCKRRLEKDMDNMDKRQAWTYIKKNVPGTRAQQLMSALNDSRAEAPVSRKKGRKPGVTSDSSRKGHSRMHVH